MSGACAFPAVTYGDCDCDYDHGCGNNSGRGCDFGCAHSSLLRCFARAAGSRGGCAAHLPTTQLIDLCISCNSQYLALPRWHDKPMPLPGCLKSRSSCFCVCLPMPSVPHSVLLSPGSVRQAALPPSVPTQRSVDSHWLVPCTPRGVHLASLLLRNSRPFLSLPSCRLPHHRSRLSAPARPARPHSHLLHPLCRDSVATAVPPGRWTAAAHRRPCQRCHRRRSPHLTASACPPPLRPFCAPWMRNPLPPAACFPSPACPAGPWFRTSSLAHYCRPASPSLARSPRTSPPLPRDQEQPQGGQSGTDPHTDMAGVVRGCGMEEAEEEEEGKEGGSGEGQEGEEGSDADARLSAVESAVSLLQGEWLNLSLCISVLRRLENP